MRGIKYAYLIFNLRPPFRHFDGTFQFDANTELRYGSIKDQLQGPNSSHWAGWVGSIAWDTVCSRRNLILVVWLQSDTVGVSDGENVALQDRVCSLFRILPLAAPFTPPTDEMFVITGTGVERDGRVIADGIQTFETVYLTV